MSHIKSKGIALFSIALLLAMSLAGCGKKMTIHRAAYLGDIKAVQAFLDRGVSVNSRSTSGYTPLFYAAEGGHISMVKLLLKNGADPNANINGYLPVCGALATRHQNIAIYMFDHGTNVHFINKNGDTFLHLACPIGGVKLVNYLVRRGLNVNACGSDGNTPIFCSAETNNVEAAAALIKLGANIHVRNKGGLTPLHWATDSYCTDVAKLLISKGLSVNATDNDGQTLLHSVAERGLSNDDGGVAAAALFISKGAKINTKDKSGNTPLQLLLKKEENPVYENPKLRRFLIAHGAK